MNMKDRGEAVRTGHEAGFAAVILEHDGRPCGVVLVDRPHADPDALYRIYTLYRAGGTLVEQFDRLRKNGYACLDFHVLAPADMKPDAQGGQTFGYAPPPPLIEVDFSALKTSLGKPVTASGRTLDTLDTTDAPLEKQIREAFQHPRPSSLRRFDSVPPTRGKPLTVVDTADPKNQLVFPPIRVNESTPPTGKRHLDQKWKYVTLEPEETHEIAYGEAVCVVRSMLGDDESAAHARLEKAYKAQESITAPLVGNKEALLVPPDFYDAGQLFMCQGCRKEYMYGFAKVCIDRTQTGYKYDPANFCSEPCGDKYREKTGRAHPPVGHEIPLCEWREGTLMTFAPPDNLRYPSSQAQLDAMAKAMNVEIVGEPIVVHDSVVIDVRPKE